MQTVQQKLLHSLGHELWQTEVSASQHGRREAERLGDTAPARALVAVAEHADEVLAELPKLAAIERPIAYSGLGIALGKVFSEVRDSLADKILTSERSYRGTLLGMRHGVDLVQLMRASVQEAGDHDLQAFFDRWLERRRPLVQEVETQLRWFAENPEQAIEQARGFFTRKPMERGVHGS